jgi:hypothetical protein
MIVAVPPGRAAEQGALQILLHAIHQTHSSPGAESPSISCDEAAAECEISGIRATAEILSYFGQLPTFCARKLSSQPTHRWREPDSNHQSRAVIATELTLSSLPVRRRLTARCTVSACLSVKRCGCSVLMRA